MAKAIARRPVAPVIVMAPRRGAVRRAAGRARHLARRAAPHARRAAKHALPVSAIAIASGAVGWADAKGYLARIPTIGGSRALTLGIAGYAATRFFSNRWVRTAGLAAVAAAAFDFGKTQGGKVSGLEGADGVDADGDF